MDMQYYKYIEAYVLYAQTLALFNSLFSYKIRVMRVSYCEARLCEVRLLLSILYSREGR